METGVVALLDALGLKGIWARAEPDQVVESWEEVLAAFAESADKLKARLGRRRRTVVDTYKVVAFSDTIIVTLRTSDPAFYIPVMGGLIAGPFILGLTKGVYFRGTISIGKFHQTGSLIIGPAIDEAAEWYEQADWIGISTSPSAFFGLESLVDMGMDVTEFFVRYNIPMKSDMMPSGWALAWPSPSLLKRIGKESRATGKTAILQAFASRPVSIEAALKFHNTLSFFDHVVRSRRRRR